MTECQECGDLYSSHRQALGFLVCLACGEQQARQIREARKKMTMPMHKSNYVYLGSDYTLHRQKAREMANKVAA